MEAQRDKIVGICSGYSKYDHHDHYSKISNIMYICKKISPHIVFRILTINIKNKALFSEIII